jgi:hypothetical protein
LYDEKFVNYMINYMGKRQPVYEQGIVNKFI